MKNKRGLEMGFGWMFAILAGMAILFLALFGVSQFIDTSQGEINTKIAAEFTNVLDPLQTSVSESSGNSITLPAESRIFTSCNLDNGFGETRVRFSEKIGFRDEWSAIGGDVSTENSYLFAEDEMEGKKVGFFIFPFDMPYKTGDVLVAYTDNYCFVDAPFAIQKELEDLMKEGNEDIIFVGSSSECPSETKEVCFSGSCDIRVQCEDGCSRGYVRKDGSQNYFVDKLLYGAIFSSLDNYECNAHRLINRLASVSGIYAKKSQFVSSRGCVNLIVAQDVIVLKESAENYENPDDLASMKIIAERIENKNEELECQLY
ncbi:hypothetical protein CMI46_02690 [Candidatus Pacearchaeota archaeon]|nr:hypothetical protein [Candidatus Pacearchaeota archaeon]